MFKARDFLIFTPCDRTSFSVMKVKRSTLTNFKGEFIGMFDEVLEKEEEGVNRNLTPSKI